MSKLTLAEAVERMEVLITAQHGSVAVHEREAWAVIKEALLERDRFYQRAEGIRALAELGQPQSDPTVRSIFRRIIAELPLPEPPK